MAEQFSWVPLTYCSLPGCSFPITSLALSAKKKKTKKEKKNLRNSANFSGSSAGKESTCNARDPSSIPGSGRSAGERLDYSLQFSWASLRGSAGKRSACNVGDLGWEDPLEKETVIHFSILAWRIPWTV